jgi:hypothetical protein
LPFDFDRLWAAWASVGSSTVLDDDDGWDEKRDVKDAKMAIV